MPQPPPPGRVYETVLYAPDIPTAREFYAGLLGLAEIASPEDWMLALRLPDGAVLLLFDPAHSAAAGRDVPGHGAVGEGHIAFSVPAGQLEHWERRFAEHEIAIEREITWHRDATSIYVRDPAGNSVELVDGEIWEV